MESGKSFTNQGKGQNKQYLIKWLYWTTMFNSWVQATDIENI